MSKIFTSRYQKLTLLDVKNFDTNNIQLNYTKKKEYSEESILYFFS
jgi:hypothetical protein